MTIINIVEFFCENILWYIYLLWFFDEYKVQKNNSYLK